MDCPDPTGQFCQRTVDMCMSSIPSARNGKPRANVKSTSPGLTPDNDLRSFGQDSIDILGINSPQAYAAVTLVGIGGHAGRAVDTHVAAQVNPDIPIWVIDVAGGNGLFCSVVKRSTRLF